MPLCCSYSCTFKTANAQHHYQDDEELCLVSRVDVVFIEFKTIVLGENIDEIPVRIIVGISRQPQPLATLSRHTQVVWIAIILC
ncbi:hypothetical protein I308_104253 [Cryptococcus tetragattii IND107]|uniref:Uncharacterized protein n=1 Tax=Cryptococcus tetragattii IND107 TaxID=1296105 RepID=A0ABR3BRD5_9TREE